MILAALLLLALGIADLVRSRLPYPRAIWIATAAAVLVFLLAADGVGLDWWWAPIAVVAISGWLAATREDTPAHRTGYWALGALAVALVAAVVFGPAVAPPVGFVVDWYDSLPYSGLIAVPFTAFALTVGGTLFLFESSNVIVRLALRGERSAPDAAAGVTSSAVSASGFTSSGVTAPGVSGPGGPRRRWWRRAPPAPVVADVRTPFTELKGGRFIGPLERVFLLALVLTGQFTALAAVIAAKGIVRFPEISKDETGGSKAEYFLVGSFASWALVVVVATLIALVS